MSKKLIKCLVGVLMCGATFNVALANEIPTCQEAVDSMLGYGESGDCLYQYSGAKMLSVDRASGVVTCQAVMSRECPDMPGENTSGETIEFTAQYGIVTHQIYGDEGY